MKQHAHLFLLFALWIGVVLIATSQARAQIAPENAYPNTSFDDTQTGLLKRADRDFVFKAAKANAEQIAIAQVAMARSNNTQVKNYAQAVLNDHLLIATDLTSLATAKGLMLATVDPLVTQRWENKSPADFDDDFVRAMFTGHNQAVVLYSQAGRDAIDSDVGNFARKQLDTLNNDLERTDELKHSLNEGK